jgi:hypothetical protein
MNQACNTCGDPNSVKEINMIWLNMILPQAVSIIALPEDTPGANLETGYNQACIFLVVCKNKLYF